MRRSATVLTSCVSFVLFVILMALAADRYIADAIPLGDRASADFFLRTVEFWVGVICAAAGGWGVITSVGILRLKPWARLSVLWFGSFVTIVSSLGLASVVYIIMKLPGMGWSWLRAVPVSVILALGMSWLILFTRPTVKRQFSAQ